MVAQVRSLAVRGVVVVGVSCSVVDGSTEERRRVGLGPGVCVEGSVVVVVLGSVGCVRGGSECCKL